ECRSVALLLGFFRALELLDSARWKYCGIEHAGRIDDVRDHELLPRGRRVALLGADERAVEEQVGQLRAGQPGGAALVDLAARGGRGAVCLARRRARGVEKWWVLKRMRPEKSGDARFLDLFRREARLSMSLAHQNIVPVFDFGRIDDQVFLAVGRVEGKDLGS